MGLMICSLFSGSTGNCTYVTDGTAKILIDAGVPPLKIERALKVLGFSADELNVLVTHRHVDHISGLAALIKKHPSTVVYAHESVAADLSKAGIAKENLRAYCVDDFYVGGITVSSYELSHDVFCVGYSLESDGKKFSYITDTGVITSEAMAKARGADVVMLESNHSVELLASGSYPYSLKRRILSDRGHLSNDACARAAVELAEAGTKYFILAHLSKENNYPELAYAVTSDALKAGGYDGVTVEVASPDRMSGFIKIL